MAESLYQTVNMVHIMKRKAIDDKKQNYDVSNPDILIGRNAVTEALKAGRGINRLFIAEGVNDITIKNLISMARERGIILDRVSKSKLNNIANYSGHQGIIAYVAPVAYTDIDDIIAKVKEKKEDPFLVLLDGVEDPHNLGALLRSADAAGVHGILLPKRNNVPLNSTVAKVSAGAIEYVPVAKIGNVSQTIQKLKREGFWIVGTDCNGEKNYYEADLTGGLVLVIGSEGYGMGRLTAELCDFIVKIPMQGQINSLNASVAGSLIMMEAMRQRLKV